MKKTIIVFAVAFVFLALASNVVLALNACDRGNLNGRSCADFGFRGGTLSCAMDGSSFDTAQCYSWCSSGYCQGSPSGAYGGTSCYGISNRESCEGIGCAWEGSGNICEGDYLNGGSCPNLFSLSGNHFILGILGCNNNCGFDVSGCEAGINCGNGNLDYGEQCEGTNFGGESCLSLNFSTGNLKCKSDCTIDTSECSNGDGDGGECGSLTKCEGIGCVDLSRDHYNCGTCGISCGSLQICTEGHCCAHGETYCSEGNVCINLKTEFSSCGACGKSCHQGQECKNGECECPSGQTYCSSADACVDLQSDNNNCGGCGNVCSSSSCSMGICKGCGSPSGNPMALILGLRNVINANVITGFQTLGGTEGTDSGCCPDPNGCNPCGDTSNPDPNCGTPCKDAGEQPEGLSCPSPNEDIFQSVWTCNTAADPDEWEEWPILDNCPEPCVSDCDRHDETYCEGDSVVTCSNVGTDEQSCWKKSETDCSASEQTCEEDGDSASCVGSTCDANEGSGGRGNTNKKNSPVSSGGRNTPNQLHQILAQNDLEISDAMRTLNELVLGRIAGTITHPTRDLPFDLILENAHRESNSLQLLVDGGESAQALNVANDLAETLSQAVDDGLSPTDERVTQLQNELDRALGESAQDISEGSCQQNCVRGNIVNGKWVPNANGPLTLGENGKVYDENGFPIFVLRGSDTAEQIKTDWAELRKKAQEESKDVDDAHIAQIDAEREKDPLWITIDKSRKAAEEDPKNDDKEKVRLAVMRDVLGWMQEKGKSQQDIDSAKAQIEDTLKPQNYEQIKSKMKEAGYIGKIGEIATTTYGDLLDSGDVSGANNYYNNLIMWNQRATNLEKLRNPLALWLVDVPSEAVYGRDFIGVMKMNVEEGERILNDPSSTPAQRALGNILVYGGLAAEVPAGLGSMALDPMFWTGGFAGQLLGGAFLAQGVYETGSSYLDVKGQYEQLDLAEKGLNYAYNNRELNEGEYTARLLELDEARLAVESANRQVNVGIATQMIFGYLMAREPIDKYSGKLADVSGRTVDGFMERVRGLVDIYKQSELADQTGALGRSPAFFDNILGVKAKETSRTADGLPQDVVDKITETGKDIKFKEDEIRQLQADSTDGTNLIKVLKDGEIVVCDSDGIPFDVKINTAKTELGRLRDQQTALNLYSSEFLPDNVNLNRRWSIGENGFGDPSAVSQTYSFAYNGPDLPGLKSGQRFFVDSANGEMPSNGAIDAQLKRYSVENFEKVREIVADVGRDQSGAQPFGIDMTESVGRLANSKDLSYDDQFRLTMEALIKEKDRVLEDPAASQSAKSKAGDMRSTLTNFLAGTPDETTYATIGKSDGAYDKLYKAGLKTIAEHPELLEKAGEISDWAAILTEPVQLSSGKVVEFSMIKQQTSKIDFYHASPGDIPAIQAELGVLTTKVNDLINGGASKADIAKAIAQREWLHYRANIAGRGGDSTGRAMSLADTLKADLNPGKYSDANDQRATGMTRDDYVNMRTNELLAPHSVEIPVDSLVPGSESGTATTILPPVKKSITQMLKEAEAARIQSEGAKLPSSWDPNDPVVKSMDGKWDVREGQDSYAMTRVKRGADGKIDPNSMTTYVIPKNMNPAEAARYLDSQFLNFEVTRAAPIVDVPMGADPILTKRYESLNGALKQVKSSVEAGKPINLRPLITLSIQVEADGASGGNLRPEDSRVLGDLVLTKMNEIRSVSWTDTMGSLRRNVKVSDSPDSPQIQVVLSPSAGWQLDFGLVDPKNPGSVGYTTANFLAESGAPFKIMRAVSNALMELKGTDNEPSQIKYSPSLTVAKAIDPTTGKMESIDNPVSSAQRALLYYKVLDDAGFVLETYRDVNPFGPGSEWVWRPKTAEEMADTSFKQKITRQQLLQEYNKFKRSWSPVPLSN